MWLLSGGAVGGYSVMVVLVAIQWWSISGGDIGGYSVVVLLVVIINLHCTAAQGTFPSRAESFIGWNHQIYPTNHA